MGIAGLIAGIVQGAVNSGYGIYQDQRDYWQQRATQDTIWRREDNAVQRRVADLEKAGLNKNLAAGSSAGAGSVVARSSSKNVDFGSTLDVLQQVEMLNKQREDTRRAKYEADISQNAKIVSDLERNDAARSEEVSTLTNAIDKLMLYYQLGLTPNVAEGHDLDGNFVLDVYASHNLDEGDFLRRGEEIPAIRELSRSYTDSANSSSILQLQKDLVQKDYDNYDTDKAFDRVGSVIRDISSGGGLINSILNTAQRAKNAKKPKQKVVEQYKKRGYTRTESYEY